MNMNGRQLINRTVLVCVLGLWAATPAYALRCGNKLVKEGMHESQIVRICGEPVATSTLGYALRYYNPINERSRLSSYTYYQGYGARRELLVTELLFNFGPPKLMRRMRFEGGRLASIETEGYGYRK